MGVSIYAGKIEDYEGRDLMGPVIDFRDWNKEILADDADERADRGEDPFIPNPKYTEHAGMNLATANARLLLSKLGFELDVEGFARIAIEDAQKAVIRGLNGKAADYVEDDVVETGAGGATFYGCGIRPGQMKAYLGKLAAIIAKGRQLGATHLVVA
jgi:hypothetical protein